MNEFVAGLKLNERFYWEVISPLLRSEFPNLTHAAARLGSGSEVLGYDDLTSTDHDWGLRMQLFLTEIDHQSCGQQLTDLLSRRLPPDFLGYSTHFGPSDDQGTRVLTTATAGRIEHRIEVITLSAFFQEYLAVDPAEPLTAFEWLTLPQQLLLGVTRGQVYTDGLGTLTEARQRLSYYPPDIWLYILAAQWTRIGQEEHFMGRAGERGDELGSRLIAGRLVHDIMQLCFLLEKRYAPYPKWFGTAFSQLRCARQLAPALQEALSGHNWQARETALGEAYLHIAKMHNALGITPPLDPELSDFFGRPFKVIYAGRFAEAIKREIRDDDVKQIKTGVGSIDQFSHSTDLRSNPELHRRLQALYA